MSTILYVKLRPKPYHFTLQSREMLIPMKQTDKLSKQVGKFKMTNNFHV